MNVNVNVNELIVAMLRRAILETRDRYLATVHRNEETLTRQAKCTYYTACNALRRS